MTAVGHMDAGAEVRDARPAALAGTLGAFVLIQLLAMARAGWQFEYPLDDVYIHLAMARELAGGGYGVNPGEYASASSSPLFTVLLAPFAESAIHRYLPLLWNLVGVTASGLLWAAILARLQARRPLPVAALWALAMLVPVFVNVAAAGFTGMEHALHTALSLALLLGLIDLVERRGISPFLIAGIVIAPLVRFEALALSVLASLALLRFGHGRVAILCLSGAILPVLGFMGFLMSLGLEPLPSSVMLKLGVGEGGLSHVERLLARLAHNLDVEPAFALLMLAAVGFAASMVAPRHGRRPAATLASVSGGAVLAHLCLGKFGWMDRYENYIITFASAAAIYLALTAARGRMRLLTSFAALAVTFSFFPFYATNFFTWHQYGPASVRLQHGQMARFVRDFAQVPVAVNDLGYVVYESQKYVLDLWGLAAPEAREARLREDRQQGWADALVRERDVALVMIYDRWLPRAAAESWLPLGTLEHNGPRGMLADVTVNFYATTDAGRQRLTDALERFEATLPGEVAFRFAPARSENGTTEKNDEP